ncbi:MAG: hypothetical protein R3B47_11255 [Bacteroidia bacterium]
MKNPGDLMVFQPSLRLHYFNDQAHVALEPRLRWKLNLPKVSLSFATGLYTQNLLAAQSDRDVVNIFQGFLSAPDATIPGRTKDHNLQTAFHLLGGIELELLPKLNTTIEVWRKDFTQLININRDKIFPEEPNFITETGEAYGADLALKYQAKALYLYGTYGLARVTRRRRQACISAGLGLPAYGKPCGCAAPEAFWPDRPCEAGAQIQDPCLGILDALDHGFGLSFTQTQGFFEKLTLDEDGAPTDIFPTKTARWALFLPMS